MRQLIAMMVLMTATPAVALDRFGGVCASLDAGNARVSELTDQQLNMETYGAEYCAADREIYQISRQIVAKGPKYAHCSAYRRAKRNKGLWEDVTKSSCAERGH